jgi:DNA-binding CsgD family transcriptional regulator
MLLKLLAMAQLIARQCLKRWGQIDRYIDDVDLVQEGYILLVLEIEAKYPGETIEDFCAATLGDSPAAPEKLAWLRDQIQRIMVGLVGRGLFRRPGLKGGIRPRKLKEVNMGSLEIASILETPESDAQSRYMALRAAIAQLLKHPGLSSRQRQVLRWKYKLSTPKKIASHLAVGRAMGIKASTVREHWKQIVKRIRKDPPTRARE